MSVVRRAAAVALAVCLAGVAAVVLWPTHPDSAGFYHLADRLLRPLVRDGAPQLVLRGSAIEFASNVLMFVPLGFLGTLALPRRFWWVIVLACCALSSCIETTQLVLLPGRTFSLRDIAANSFGGLVGSAVAAALQALISALSRRRPAASQ